MFYIVSSHFHPSSRTSRCALWGELFKEKDRSAGVHITNIHKSSQHADIHHVGLPSHESQERHFYRKAGTVGFSWGCIWIGFTVSRFHLFSWWPRTFSRNLGDDDIMDISGATFHIFTYSSSKVHRSQRYEGESVEIQVCNETCETCETCAWKISWVNRVNPDRLRSLFRLYSDYSGADVRNSVL